MWPRHTQMSDAALLFLASCFSFPRQRCFCWPFVRADDLRVTPGVRNAVCLRNFHIRVSPCQTALKFTKVTFFRNILCIYCLFVVYYWSEMVGYTRYYYAFLVCDIKLFVNVKDLQNFKHKCIYFCAICVPNSSLTSCSIGLELICIMPVYGVHWLNSLFAPPSNSVCSCGEDEIQIW